MLRLEPKAFDLLVYLIANRERVVSKDDLLAAVWNGRIVSELALTCINAVRMAIGDSGKVQREIKTLPRKGFRFVDGDHCVGHVSVGLCMDLVGCLLVWCIHKTERRSTFSIVPIRQELHSVFALDFQVLDVQFSNLLRGKFDHIVTV